MKNGLTMYSLQDAAVFQIAQIFVETVFDNKFLGDPSTNQ